ncbi:hypothetical protein MLD38_019363 [Melastoma candidum]|uniref:Uncharacterized protein n=1 Tax=Melastoma candidum TaxID=119954 RepID=A0ACB9QXW2_9MYRT|nr:hypothetical protein MLD38_019363 [Melastoma candidum]
MNGLYLRCEKGRHRRKGPCEVLSRKKKHIPLSFVGIPVARTNLEVMNGESSPGNLSQNYDIQKKKSGVSKQETSGLGIIPTRAFGTVFSPPLVEPYGDGQPFNGSPARLL